MYDFLEEEVVEELKQEGYTAEDIEEYIRQEVEKDKREKYRELDDVKLTYFVFLLGLVGVDAFKNKV